MYTQLALSLAPCKYSEFFFNYLGCVSNILYICMYMYVFFIVYFPTHRMWSSSDALSVMLNSKSTTSLTISWTLADGVTATGYTISYSNTNNTECITAGYPDITTGASESSRELMDLEEGTEYSITVTARLSGGGTGEDSLTATTIIIGQYTSQSSLSLLSPLF